MDATMNDELAAIQERRATLYKGFEYLADPTTPVKMKTDLDALLKLIEEKDAAMAQLQEKMLEDARQYSVEAKASHILRAELQQKDAALKGSRLLYADAIAELDQLRSENERIKSFLGDGEVIYKNLESELQLQTSTVFELRAEIQQLRSERDRLKGEVEQWIKHYNELEAWRAQTARLKAEREAEIQRLTDRCGELERECQMERDNRSKDWSALGITDAQQQMKSLLIAKVREMAADWEKRSEYGTLRGYVNRSAAANEIAAALEKVEVDDV